MPADAVFSAPVVMAVAVLANAAFKPPEVKPVGRLIGAGLGVLITSG